MAFDREIPQDIALELARIVDKIYQIAHSANPNHSCYNVHNDWRNRTEELYQKALERV